jgi:carbonic anhydrase/acetyltransferase-like protein (isoleucine patch superfamily)
MQDIDPTAWIAPSAQLFGAITIGANASVWHNAVMRADSVSTSTSLESTGQW